jgi:DNA modification methylase
MSIKLINDDCLNSMKDLSNNSIDLLFCDLPYGETACKWDCLIDLNLFWKEINRICKLTCPMFFTCSTRFGVSLINSNPKNFRYDLVWVKSAPCSFLNSKKMPMRKHEMIYVFYRKLPLYNLSSHTHKYLKDGETLPDEYKDTQKNKSKDVCKYDVDKNVYGGGKEGRIKISKDKKDHEIKYDPPLPSSVIRDTSNYKNDSDIYGKIPRPDFMRKNGESRYDPPLPNSVIKEEEKCRCFGANFLINKPNFRKCKDYKYNNLCNSTYDPPLPHSILEMKCERGKHSTQKPISLIEWCLKYYSKEGDMVLDPTMGSGSTGVACKNMNRNFIGIEKDEKIYNKAVERIN